MSLDVYLITDGYDIVVKNKNFVRERIFIRENGQTREITQTKLTFQYRGKENMEYLAIATGLALMICAILVWRKNEID